MKIYAVNSNFQAYLYVSFVSAWRKFKILFLLILCSIFSFPSYAVQVVNIPMDLSSWSYIDGEDNCKLTHAEVKVPHGKFYFLSEVNNKILFKYNFHDNQNIWKTASLSLITPPWVHPEKVTSISRGVLDSSSQYVFSSNIPELLEGLNKGQWLKLSLDGSPASRSVVTILPSVRVNDAISQFIECKQKLPSITYAQARDTYLHYMSGHRNLNATQRRNLRDLVSYIRWDSRVTQVLIDGHTDSVSSRLTNLNISQARASAVAQYLNKLGIEADKMQIRAHGSRYPAASNHTEQGRAQNRRVVIRLVRNNEKVGTAISNSNTSVRDQ